MAKYDLNGVEVRVGQHAVHGSDDCDAEVGTVVDLLSPDSHWVRVKYDNDAIVDIEEWHLVIVH